MKIEEAIKRYSINAEYERTHGNLQGCLEFRQLADWLKELKQLREQTRWIPVSEKVPEEHKEVLTCSLCGFIEIQSYEHDYWENQHGDWTDLELEEVTHWMPLPTPYEPQERGKTDADSN